MKNIERRLTKLENAAERRFDLSGRLVLRQIEPEWLIALSKIPGAAELVRESTALMMRGVAHNSPEMLDLQRRLDEVWQKHCDEEWDGDEYSVQRSRGRR
jgi:hypothetical protein